VIEVVWWVAEMELRGMGGHWALGRYREVENTGGSVQCGNF
jgi:hypothetical protein